ncbi:MAG: hypothetical protein PF569_10160 [Candidatus Woesearchaeota archaeon]|jgi:hypothetical protein|nr:hypothetical protein [Candidatus Woesearchaeota archaeon]
MVKIGKDKNVPESNGLSFSASDLTQSYNTGKKEALKGVSDYVGNVKDELITKEEIDFKGGEYNRIEVPEKNNLFSKYHNVVTTVAVGGILAGMLAFNSGSLGSLEKMLGSVKNVVAPTAVHAQWYADVAGDSEKELVDVSLGDTLVWTYAGESGTFPKMGVFNEYKTALDKGDVEWLQNSFHKFKDFETSSDYFKNNSETGKVAGIAYDEIVGDVRDNVEFKGDK